MQHRDLLDFEDMKEMMELKRGDVFRNGDTDEVLQIKGFQTNGDVMVTDPTVSHPQDGRSGTWPIPVLELFEDWSRNIICPASLEAAEK